MLLRHFINFSLTSLVVCCASAQPLGTLESQCESRLAPAEVVVKALPGHVRYDFTLGIRELTARGNRQRRLGQTVLGLTEYKLRTAIEWESNAFIEPHTGRACMRPRVELTLDADPQTVFVAREFPQGSCAFTEIANHELRHVYANQHAVERAASTLRGELSSFFGQRIFYGQLPEMKAQLEAALKESWLPRARAQLNTVATEHNLIDSHAEYARFGTVCNGAISSVLKHEH